MTPELWDDRFAVNARHQFFVAQAVAPGWARRAAGRSSIWAPSRGCSEPPGVIAYTSAKSTIEGLTKSLARELGRSRSASIQHRAGLGAHREADRPGQATDPSKFQAYLDRQCLKEHLEPADIARLALWLASNESRRCTGQTFIVDAGVV
jgi:NAD(P)-dependent dehydrogenase (short-subunit alcohol dehydrogenase family)